MKMNHMPIATRAAVALFVCLLTRNISGNLASVSASDIQRTGNLVLRQQAAIQLDYENLAVRLDAESATVSVNYKFLNKGSTQTISVAFPVDLMPPSGEGTSYNVDHWQDESLTGFQIFDGTTRLPIEQTIEERLVPEDRPLGIEDASTTRRWFLANLDFKAGEHKTVRIDYTVRCMGVDSGFEGETESAKFTPRTFLYTLRPAKSWGNGRIRKLDVTIDKTFLDQNRLKIVALRPKPETNDSGILRWSFKDFNLATAPDFICTYDSTPALLQKKAGALLLKKIDNLRAKISGGVPGKRNIEALFDQNLKTAWLASSETKGIGASIELRPKKDTSLYEIALLNGYLASEEGYAAYPKIKRLRIECITRFEEGPKREVTEVVLPDRPFDERAIRFPASYADYVIHSGGPEGILESVKLTVLEIYPSIDANPIAISELYLYGRDFHRR
jgi:hypothetical protein